MTLFFCISFSVKTLVYSGTYHTVRQALTIFLNIRKNPPLSSPTHPKILIDRKIQDPPNYLRGPSLLSLIV
jgi:hypothetical protein